MRGFVGERRYLEDLRGVLRNGFFVMRDLI